MKAAGPVTVTVKMPLAAVLPDTPEIRTRSPVASQCGLDVPMAMGAVLETVMSDSAFAATAFAIESRIVCSTAVDCVPVKAIALSASDWPRSR